MLYSACCGSFHNFGEDHTEGTTVIATALVCRSRTMLQLRHSYLQSAHIDPDEDMKCIVTIIYTIHVKSLCSLHIRAHSCFAPQTPLPRLLAACGGDISLSELLTQCNWSSKQALPRTTSAGYNIFASDNQPGLHDSAEPSEACVYSTYQLIYFYCCRNRPLTSATPDAFWSNYTTACHCQKDAYPVDSHV